MSALEKNFGDVLDSLSEDCLETIAQALIDDKEEGIALEILKEYGELTYFADDGNCEVEYSYVDSKEEAATEYVAQGDWGDSSSSTSWVTISAWEAYTLGNVTLDDEESSESFDIPIEPDEPHCEECDHEWISPHEIVGGCESNPGVIGNGGGVVIHEVCKHCGCLKVTDTWAQNPENGPQGLKSVSYDDGEHDYKDAWRRWRVAEGLDEDEE